MVRALKILVILMGVVLVGGFTLVAVEVVRRANAPATARTEAARTAPAPGPAAAGMTSFETHLDLAPGARVGTAVATGDRVVVPVIMPGGGVILYSFDPVTGANAGTIHITGQE